MSTVSSQARGQEAQSNQALPPISLYSLDEEECRAGEPSNCASSGLTQPSLNNTHIQNQWPDISRHVKRQRSRHEGVAIATGVSFAQGDANKKVKRQWGTDRGKVLFSIDGGVWDNGDEDEGEDEGSLPYEHYQEECALQQIKKHLWDAKFKGRNTYMVDVVNIYLTMHAWRALANKTGEYSLLLLPLSSSMGSAIERTKTGSDEQLGTPSWTIFGIFALGTVATPVPPFILKQTTRDGGYSIDNVRENHAFFSGKSSSDVNELQRPRISMFDNDHIIPLYGRLRLNR